MIPLTELGKQVEEFAGLCLPDFTYTSKDLRGLRFEKIDLSEFTGDDKEDPYCGLKLEVDEVDKPHVFTRWSRGQLLSHLGCREKWFESVAIDQEVDELNKRLHVLRPYMLRTMKSYYSEDLLVVRGLVSRHFADIPDTAIMKALTDVLPEGYAVAHQSGKTDRAFYAYAVTEKEISIPNTDFVALPGVVIKNSEVGYTSLWVVPMMFIPEHGVCIVLRKHASLRKVHRGDASDLAAKFSAALESAKVLWGSLAEKIDKLKSLSFLTEEDALVAMSTMLKAAGSEQGFITACTAAYKEAAHTSHSAMGILNAIMVCVKKECDKDDAYVSSELAGAVLLQILK